MSSMYNNNAQIVQHTYHVVLLSEMVHDARIVREPLINVCEAVNARQKSAKKRSLSVINAHFELIFNAAITT